jgi:nickel/cobalt transporter (NicO) family protein
MAATVLVAGGLIAIPLVASGHPLGNFTVNQFLGLVVTPAAVEVDYVLDMAEIPAYQERQSIDTDGDDMVSQREEAAYRLTACSDRSADINLSYDGLQLDLTGTGTRVSFPEGQAGLVTLRLECTYRAEGSGISLMIENGNYGERTGWSEVVVGSNGVDISSKLPATSVSARLTAYPKDPSTATSDVRSGSIIVGGTGVPDAVSSAVVAAPGTRTPVDAFGSLIARGDQGTGPAVVALAAAVVLGAGHALAPGHGKTIIAAYLVGNRGTVRQGLGLGLSVAVSHTVGVLALGLATLVASRSFQPERVYPYLSAASGLIVLGIGIGLITRSFRRIRHDRAHQDGHHHHDHQHDHRQGVPVIGWKGLMALGLSGGLAPSASAVVLLLGAVNLGKVEFGIVLVAAFGVGMATAMVGVGLGLVAATRLGVRKLTSTAWLPRMAAILPAAMGGLVTVVGVAMLLTAGRNLTGA